MVWNGYASLLVVAIVVSHSCVDSDATCTFLSTAETLNDCDWSRWCWSCDQCQCGVGIPYLVRGKCCSGNDSTDARCKAKCGGKLNDVNMTTLGQCSTTCKNRSDPNVCKTDPPQVTTSPCTTTVRRTSTITVTIPSSQTTKVNVASTSTITTQTTKPSHITQTTNSSNITQTTKSQSMTTMSRSASGESEPGTSLGPIIGGAVGGVVLIAALIGLAVYFLKKKKSHTNHKIEPEISKEPLSNNIDLDVKMGAEA